MDTPLSAHRHYTSESRRAAFKALEKWMLTMQGHARVVLRGRPQLLEMLGVSPRR